MTRPILPNVCNGVSHSLFDAVNVQLLTQSVQLSCNSLEESLGPFSLGIASRLNAVGETPHERLGPFRRKCLKTMLIV